MNPFAFMRRLSTRFHMAMGLSALTIGVLLSASYLQLIPDGEALERQNRASMAETIAITVSSVLDVQEPEALADMLAFVSERNSALLSIGVRSQGGALLLDIHDHAANWTAVAGAASTDSEISVPVWKGGQPWGAVELRFTPMRAAGWRGYLQERSLRLSAFVFVGCAVFFCF